MEQLKHMKESIMAHIQGQMGNLQNVDAKELGEAIDMVKDLEEAIYYCSIVKAMEESKEEKKYTSHYYSQMPMMYYNGGGNGNSSGSNGNGRMNYGTMYYEDEQYPLHLQPHESARYIPEKTRDVREGRSPIPRRKYMESKHMHKDEITQKKELEEYMNELTRDIMEMISDTTPDQKMLLSQKLSTLASKIQ